MMHITTRCLLGLLLLAAAAADARGGMQEAAMRRFFFSGDGQIRLVSEKSGAVFSGRYRSLSGRYEPAGLAGIHRVFAAPFTAGKATVSLRLIEYLDFLEDRLHPGAEITITSGYRSPAYNSHVRRRGGLAAKASLHQYGMAADIVMQGVSSRRVWETVRALDFGGAGYYHGRTVHVDVGPARSWDEKTSGVGTGISDDNKLIGLVAGYDLYRPGETLSLRFIRMTAFPVGVSTEFLLEGGGSGGEPLKRTFRPEFARPVADACPSFDSIDAMAAIRWRLPADLPAGRYTVRARFCGNPWKEMPPEVVTPAFEIIVP